MQAITAMEERSETNATAAGDAELLRRFIDDRDAAAMTAIIERHGPLVMGLCRGILRNEQDAADAFQTTFLVLLKNAASIGKPASLSSWLHGVACRVALRARSQAARRRERESAGAAMSPNQPSQTDDAADAETLRLIHEELSNLPERMRLPLLLCCVEGASREEAARQLGWTLGSLKGRLERAREMLHKRLTRRGVVLSTAALTGVLAGQGAVKVPAALAASTVHSLVLVAAGTSLIGGVVSANAAALTTGVLISMKVAKLKIAGLVALAVLMTAGTSVVVVHTVQEMIAARQPQPVAVGTVPVVGFVNQLGVPTNELPQPVMQMNVVEVTPDQSPTDQDRARERLFQLALAMHRYHDAHGAFPPAAIRAADGTPLLSWRVAILPYLGEGDIYSAFKLDEPWDSPHNRRMLEATPSVFLSASANSWQPGETFFQVFTGPGTVFPETGTTKISDISDGASDTLLIVESATAVPWTKPADLPYAPNQPLPPLGGLEPGAFFAVKVDGSLSVLRLQTSEQTLRAKITANAGD